MEKEVAFDIELELSFGPTPYFAGHPDELEYAFKWLVLLRKRGDSWGKAKAMMEAFMRRRGLGDEENIRVQVADAERMVRPWLHFD